MKQLSHKEKYNQMSNKYKSISINTVISMSKSKSDLQGWRNKLIDISSSLNPNNLLDVGGGNGQQMLRFKSIHKNSFIAWIVDFAERPKEILELLKINKFNFIKQDVFQFLKNNKSPNFDMIYMFGFLHEIKNVKKLLIELKKKTDVDCFIIISDNDLYRSANELSLILNNTNTNFTVYNSKSYFNMLHIFTKISGKGKKKLYCFHKGRVDKILAVCGSLKRKIQFINLI